MQKHSLLKKSKWLDLLIFVLFANVFFFHKFGTLAIALLLTGLWILVSRVFGRLDWRKSMMLVPVISLLFFVDSPEKIAILTLLFLSIVFVSVYTWLKQAEIGGILEMVLSGVIVVREYVASQWLILKATISGNLRKVLQLDKAPRERSPWIRSITVGLLMGFPLVTWLVSTLTKADPIFAQFIKQMFSEKFLTQLPSRFIFSILILLFLIPMLVMKLRPYISPVGWLTKMRWGREMTVVTAMVAAVLGIFLIIQWPYVFATVARETDLSKYGVATYSEYVQKGFWDLLKVVVMVFGVAWAGLLINKNQVGKERDLLMWIQGILGIEFLIFVISIFRRVWFYQSYHGLSLARLYGLVLLLGIAGMTVTMALRYFYHNVRWVKVEVAWILLVVYGTILINMESLVVKDPPTVNGRIDYVYLSRLPGDGYEGWKTAFDHTNDKLAEIVSAKLPGIGVDNRREVLYGGLILAELTENYDNLIWQYGSEDEIKEYLRGVLQWEKMMLAKYPEIATSRVTGGREEIIEVIEEVGKMIDGDEWGKIGVMVNSGVSPYYVGKYTFSGYDISFYGLQRSEFENSKRLSRMDSLMSWNGKDMSIYKKMRQELPLDSILKVIEDYWKIRLQIITQPETERTVEIDISMDSPFLR